MKPKVFIGSSREGLPIANAIHANMTHEAECTVWKDGVFQPSSSTLADLVRTLRVSDFAVFVFSPDDLTVMRGTTDPVVRDNVIFELGLFIGRLGIERCFFLVPDAEKLRLPTDMYGVMPTKYESGRSDKNWMAAVNPACMQISVAINNLKSFQDNAVAGAVAQSPTLATAPTTNVAHKSSNVGKLQLNDYKKSVLLTGDTKKYKERLLALGYASWNSTLNGWVIPKSKESLARVDLEDLL